MKLSPEERKERKREDNKRYRQNMTEEQKETTKEYFKRYRQNMTEEQKEERKVKRNEYRASLKTIFQLKYLDNLLYYGTVYYM